MAPAYAPVCTASPGSSSSTGSSSGFIRFGSSSPSNVDDESDWEDKRELAFRKSLTYVDRIGDELTAAQVKNWHRVVRNQMTEVTGLAQPPQNVVEEYEANGESPTGPGMVALGYKNRRAAVRLARNRALAGTLATLPHEDASPEKGYMGDVGTPVRPLYLRSHIPKDLTTSLMEPIRFCMFNTGRISAREFWNTLKLRLTDNALMGISRVQPVCQPNGNFRIDFWAESGMAARMKQALYMTAAQRRKGTRHDYRYPLAKLSEFWIPNKEISSWRLDYYRQWRDRMIEPRQERPAVPTPRLLGLASLNVNGIHGKRSLFVNFLKAARIGIVAVQETLVGINDYRLHIPGYEVFSRAKRDSFRGQALLISKAYPAYQVGSDADNSFIHVKVAGLVDDHDPWHIISVYYPSGGSHRSARTGCLNRVLKEYKSIVDKDPKAAVVILGDHNMSRAEVQKRIKTGKTGLECLSVSGSGLTFHRKGSRWSDIDNIIVSPNARAHLTTSKVARNFDVESDHYPLVTRLRRAPASSKEAAEVPHSRFNLDLVKGHGGNIVNSNRWALLSVEPIETIEELNEGVEAFDNNVNTLATEMGIKQQVIGKTLLINRQLKRKVDRMAKLRKELAQATRVNSLRVDELSKKVKQLKRTVKRDMRQRASALHTKEVKRVSKMFMEGEMRAFNRWESETTTGGHAASSVKPIQDKNGKLLTRPSDIRQRTYIHYKELNQDDPEKLSRNKDYWTGRFENTERTPLPGVNDAFEWRNVLLAIRKMALGTAPGHNDIPVEMYKSMLKEECHAELERVNASRIGDNIYVALPEHLLPRAPRTQMGKALWRIIEGIWKSKHQPGFWAKVTNISLFKSGDPTDPKNYRGISLICVAMKIVTAMMAERLSTILEANNILAKEQGGFRSHEEAIAQFIALAEIVRRRRLKGSKTYVVFIDFFKAFDKVMHEALFEKLDGMGFGGHFLDLLRSIYQTSEACLKVGGENSPYYDMLRGTRQGCPLSPILFIIFINDLLKYLPKGVQIPDIKEGESHCAALLFADDVAGLCETVEQVHEFLAGITAWSKAWRMPMGASKCGVMLVMGSEEEQAALKKVAFEVDGQRIEVVRQYKYLGIIITDKFGDKEQTDELNHCKTLAAKVKQAVNIRRGFLRDRTYPLEIKLMVINSKILSVGTYGGEWIAFNQKRTNIIQKEVNVALKLILQSSTKSKLHATKVMCWELGLTTVEERTSDLRLRLWQKAPSLRTWLAVLVNKENNFRNIARVWSSQTRRVIDSSKENCQIPVDEGWIWDTLHSEGKVKHIPAESENVNTRHERERQDFKLRIIGRAFQVDLTGKNPVQSTKDYVSKGHYSRSRKYIRTAAHLPNLTEGIIWLVRMRTSAWWSSRRRRDYLRHSEQDLSHLPLGKCPLCKNTLPEMEIQHILLDCPSWNKERNLWLQPLISLYEKQIVDGGHGALDANFAQEEITHRLLGGWFVEKEKGHYTLNHDPKLSVLTDLAKGWGGMGEYQTYGLGAHGYIPVAKFLAAVMPRHKARLFPSGGRPRDNVAYGTTTEEESPVKSSDHITVPDAVEDGGDFYYQRSRTPFDNELAHETLQAEALRGRARIRKHAILDLDTSPEGSVGEYMGNLGYESPLALKTRRRQVDQGVF